MFADESMESTDTAPDSDLASSTSSDPGGATETPTADATEPASGEPSESTAGQPRDAHGRFATKAEDTAPDPTADGPATDDPLAPATIPGTDPAGAPTATEPPPEAPSATADRPFTFLHRGQMHDVPGAVVKPDGSLVVPAPSRARIEQMLARGREHEVMGPQLVQQHQREVTTLRQQLEQRHVGVEAFGKLLEGNPDPETFLARALQFYEELPALREQMTRAEIEARDRRIAELEGRGGAPNGQPSPEAGPPPEQMAEAIRSGTGNLLAQVADAVPEFKGFTAQELAPYGPQLLKRAGLYVRAATTEDEQLYGTPAGSPVLDADAFVHELKLLAGDAIRQKQAAAAKAKVQPQIDAAAKRNAAVTKPVTAPPVPKPGPGGTPAGGDREYESYDDWKQNFVYKQRRAG